MMITGTAGDDDLTGTGTIDDFYLGDGGNDIAHGLAGDDSFAFGAEFTGHDSVFGGAGNDTILIAATASTLHISGTTIDSVESLLLLDGSDYTLSMKNSAVDDGKTLAIDGGGLSIGHSLKLFASTELDGNYVAVGGADNDIFETGAGNDTIYGGDGADAIQSGYGRDTINAGSDDDVIYFIGDGALGAGDRANGGGGSFADTLDLSGDYSAGLTITAKMLADIDIFKLEAGNDYTLDFSRANADLFNLVLDGGALGASDVLNFTAAENKHVSFFVQGGAADDAIAVGTAVNNYLQGGGGADTLTGNTNVDVFSYVETADSTGQNYDTVIGFNAAEDFIETLFSISGVAPDAVDPMVKHGTLSAASFDADLEAAVGAGQLGVDHAVLYQAKHGTLAGVLFVIVDGNGVAGYQADEDLVVRLDGAKHVGDFDLGNFGTPG